jgi:hypothetical protein
MACEKPAEPVEALHYPIQLTQKQRRIVLECVRLPGELEARLRAQTQGSGVVSLTKSELGRMSTELGHAISATSGSTQFCLERVEEKLGLASEAIELEEPLPPACGRVPATDIIFQVKIVVDRVTPPVWRRVLVPDITLGELHRIIQVVLGWSDSHFHEFAVDRDFYCAQLLDDFGLGVDHDDEDEDAVLLSQVALDVWGFDYTYGLGDDQWELSIDIERERQRAPGVKYPRCTGGQRANPPENVGGAWGYEHFIDRIEKRNRRRKTCVLQEFDPEDFSVAEVNRLLRLFT